MEPGPLQAAQLTSKRMFAAYLRGEVSAAELAEALRAEYRLAGWLR